MSAWPVASRRGTRHVGTAPPPGLRRPPRPVRERLGGEDGLVAGAEVVVVGSLVFVVGLLLLINAWNVVDARFTADAAAREATRAFVEADPGHAEAAAHDAAATAMAAMGRAGTPQLQVDGELRRCARVTISATVTTATVRLPFIGGWGEPWALTASHSEVVDPYRRGLPGTADCTDR